MKINYVLADAVTINTPVMCLKRNVLVNNGFPGCSKYKFRRFKGYKTKKSRYHMKK